MAHFLVVGLGNPGKQYANTWHNLGALALKKIESINQTLHQEVKKQSNFILLQPKNFMNLSGIDVQQYCEKYKIPPENVIVLCDDIYIERGKIKVSKCNGDGGHNGLRSITQTLMSNAYTKIRIGAKPLDINQKGNTADYVLSQIDSNMEEILQEAAEKALELIS
ncbi:MAG: aminoacyl-tRNA hydrolase [Christensenellaceae bacterium]|jgi:PTH1 family peptidyl-tRNA hydrolase|nr:aminoacyl-tRNA hydrolase [Christensenellaceae bacterium]